MTGSSVTAAPNLPRVRQLRIVLIVMVAVLALSALIAFGPLANEAPASEVDAVRRVDYAIRHLGETPTMATSRTADYGLRHLAVPSPDRSSSVDYPLRHLGE